jgi:hypothetical protein
MPSTQFNVGLGIALRAQCDLGADEASEGGSRKAELGGEFGLRVVVAEEDDPFGSQRLGDDL